MPVPSSINDLSTTAASNYPQGTDTPGTGDDTIRALSAFIAQLRDMLNGTSNTGTVKNAAFSGAQTGASSWSGLQSFTGGISVSGASGNVLTGTYAPTLNAGANCTGTPSANGLWIWVRIGNSVVVHGSISTTGGFGIAGSVSVIYASIPVASNFTASQDAHGHGQFSNATAYGNPFIDADPVGDRVELVFNPATTSGGLMFFSFAYLVK